VHDALKQAGIPAAAMATYVQTVDGKKTLIASNINNPMNPASTMKLVTTNAALDLLGPTHSWKTQAYISGEQQGDVLHGDLIIKGGGDPKLVFENFWLFLRQIRAKGIRSIDGNLLLDRSAFALPPFDPATFDGDPLKAYNAQPDALLLNFKSLRFQFSPDQGSHTVQVSVEPPLAIAAINAPLPGAGKCGDWQAGLNANITARHVGFDGTFPFACGDRHWALHPYQMSQTDYFAAVFNNLWQALGGNLKGQVKDGLTPPNARFLTEWESVSLAEVIRDINKYSNNVMARQLLISLTAGDGAASLDAATPERGAQAVKQWLAAKGINAPELVIENGSGLSRSARISARTMGRMLVAAFASPLMPEFMASMPLLGVDGTMRKRLTLQTAAGNAHIKSGSLRDVRAIAGYVLAASGKRYTIVSIINHDNAQQGQAAHDALLEWVYEHG
jgi:D-alanyl-D-alanine carboxypeptidase/D-alanyl-D-alanine-endopeptidase (penicillin-binding protein 4)